MKNRKVAAITISLLLCSAIFSLNGATAEERNKAQNEEFRGSGIRSHGHPIANLSDAPSIGSRQNQQSYVSNDDANGELEWQKWNKQNEINDRKSNAAAKILNSAASNPIIYHTGGPIGLYTGATQVIPVWVGNWSDAARKDKWNRLLANLVTSLGESGDIGLTNHVLNTNSLYFTSKNATRTLLTWPNVNVTASIPATLRSAVGGIVPVSDADVATYINSAISKGIISVPPAGVRPIYVYIGANNTRLSSGFGTAYCGWHTYGTLGAKNIPYIAIQDFNSNYAKSCAAQTVSPNDDYQLDAMASVLVHEIDEVLTDPDIRTWYDSRGAENADKCAWTFGTTNLINGAKYNFTTSNNGAKYLIQRNWLADNLVKDTATGSACVTTI
jgi:hypothetical protein